MTHLRSFVRPSSAAILPSLLAGALGIGCGSAPETFDEGEPVTETREPLTGTKPIVVLRCRYSDDTSDLIQYAPHVAVMNGANAFWTQASYGNVNLNGSIVRPSCSGSTCSKYYPIGPRSSYETTNGAGGIDVDLEALTRDCTGAADASVNFASFYGVIIAINANVSAGGTFGSFGLNPPRDGVSSTQVIWSSLPTSHVYAHEIGHTFSLPHVLPEPAGMVAGVSYETMASGSTNTAMFHKDVLGWVPASRKFVVTPGTTSITLERTALPPASGYLMAEVAVPGEPAKLVFEARRRAGLDNGLPAEGVVVTYADQREGAWVSYMDPDGDTNVNEANSFFTPGESFTNTAVGITASVTGQTATGYVVSLAHSPPACTGTGVSATYFDEGDFTGPSVTRTEPRLSFDWQDGSPDPNIDGDSFSARFAGEVLPPATGAYKFHASADDYYRLWVNGQLVIDGWDTTGGCCRELESAPINLVAGQKYPIAAEFREDLGLASFRVGWSTPSTYIATIPACYLFAPSASTLFGPDTFEDGIADGWTPYTASQWVVVTDSGNKAYKRTTSTGSWNDSRAGSSSWTNQVVEARVKVTQFGALSSSRMATLYARYSGTSPSASSAYYAALRGDGALAIRKRVNGSNTTLATVTGAGIVAGTWYTTKLEALSSGSSVVLKLHLNGTLRATYTDATPLGSGRTGVGSYGAAVQFDDVKVTAGP